MSNNQIRLQCKSSAGKHVLTGLTMQSTVACLKQLITKVTNIPSEQQKIFYGYPPKHANLSDDNLQLSNCPFRSGDLLIVEKSLGPKVKDSSSKPLSSIEKSTTIPKTRKSSGILIRKVVPANNSCLFTSVNTVMNNGLVDLSCADSMRKLAAKIVMNDPVTYSTALLGQENSKYINWLLKEDSWGGAIEISVLSKHYNVEIDVVDTQSGRIDRFGEDQKYDKRVLLIYDGIHYDPLILELDDSTCETIFSTSDDDVLQQALEIAAVAKANRQFTDVNKFTLRCIVCQTQLTGQSEAQQHAEQTGHIQFGQI
ncbi:ubiquitin thioesterase OTU1-like [Octopus vulgaris]|nr:ubiquitin thioesterase OTU1-like [Octopus sinensis]XP_036358019.1 ubiquitin thioesterase OTU1-like [Octopus sinensis]CAI9721474.1 ubiquitin thioesterase OTU1-like [Octopus vulgaris]